MFKLYLEYMQVKWQLLIVRNNSSVVCNMKKGVLGFEFRIYRDKQTSVQCIPVSGELGIDLAYY